MYLIEMFGVSLLLTLLIEGIVSRLFGLCRKREMLLVILINVLTNPLAVLLYWLCIVYLQQLPMVGMFAIQLMIECTVVVSEALIYRGFSKELPQIRHPFILSVTANGLSWLSGLILNQWL